MHKIRLFEFDGTKRGFHLMMLRLFPVQNWRYEISFLNYKHDPCHDFQGIVKINKIGLILKKYCWYQVPVSC